MSLGLLLHHITALIAIAVVCFAFSNWRAPRTLYYTCYALAIAVYAVGYMLEGVAPTLEAAVVACRVQYYGIPFVAPFYYLFSRDFGNNPVRSRPLIVGLMVLPALFTVLVNTWPHQQLFYRDLALASGPFGSYLVITPGPLYHVATLYNVGIMALGTSLMVRYYLQAGGPRRDLVVFLSAFVLLVLSQVQYITGFGPEGWDSMAMALVLNAAILGWYMNRFRMQEWAGLGREMVVENMKDAFILLDTRGRFLDANAMACSYFPALAQLPVGAEMQEVPGFPAQLLSSLADDSDFTLEKDGETLYMRASRSPLKTGDKVVGISLLIFDDTETRYLLNELQELATHDALTGLYNRGTFFQYASRDYDLSMRKREDGSILMMDIDHFKNVNDQHGHQAGDLVLQGISKILMERLRHTDISGRYGGEELAVWLPDAAAEGASMIADVIRRAVEHTLFESERGQFHVTISIGVAGLDHIRHQSFEQLVSEADAALYQAKREGRNRVCVYTAKSVDPYANQNVPPAFLL